MPSPTPSLAPSPKRRVLHERSQSQTNQLPTSSVRLVQEKDLDPKTGIYSTTPYPTKPEHVLLPTTGNTHGVGFSLGDTVSDPYLDPTTGSPSSLEHDRRHSTPGDVFDRSSTTFLAGDSSSLAWADDPNSSKTSIPRSETPLAISGASGLLAETEEKDLAEDDHLSHSGSIVALPATTIKAVPPETPSPSSLPADPSRIESASDSSSPNFVPLGATSSPNFVPLRSSSPNFLAVGSSSPNIVRARQSNASLYSPDSTGTTRRYANSGGRHRTSSGGEASDQSSISSPSDLYPSSPPAPVLRSFQSASSFALPPPGSVLVRPGSLSISDHSDQSLVDVQAIVRSELSVQYPTIRSASSSSLRANSLPPRTASSTSAQSITDRSSDRWGPHLSTVPSEWTPELLQNNFPVSPPNENTQPSGRGLGSRAQNSRASIWIVDQSEAEESGDNLTQLRTLPLRGKVSGSLRSQPSSPRLNSLKRTVSSASTISNAIPAWARTFYLTGGRDLLVFSPSFFEPNRPTTPSEARAISRPPLMEISRPRTRPQHHNCPPPALPINPADPRSHWAPQPQADPITPATSVIEYPASWSPHLHQDKRAGPVRQSVWKAPSLDESRENFFTRRNLQIYSFVLGFVCPLIWFVASFLPLPSRVSHVAEKNTTANPDVEQAFHDPVALAQEVHYQNARWWRNLNRCMTPLGLVIIAVIIVLSVLGTRANGL